MTPAGQTRSVRAGRSTLPRARRGRGAAHRARTASRALTRSPTEITRRAEPRPACSTFSSAGHGTVGARSGAVYFFDTETKTLGHGSRSTLRTGFPKSAWLWVKA